MDPFWDTLLALFGRSGPKIAKVTIELPPARELNCESAVGHSGGNFHCPTSGHILVEFRRFFGPGSPRGRVDLKLVNFSACSAILRSMWPRRAPQTQMAPSLPTVCDSGHHDHPFLSLEATKLRNVSGAGGSSPHRGFILIRGAHSYS